MAQHLKPSGAHPAQPMHGFHTSSDPMAASRWRFPCTVMLIEDLKISLHSSNLLASLRMIKNIKLHIVTDIKINRKDKNLCQAEEFC